MSSTRMRFQRRIGAIALPVVISSVRNRASLLFIASIWSCDWSEQQHYCKAVEILLQGRRIVVAVTYLSDFLMTPYPDWLTIHRVGQSCMHRRLAIVPRSELILFKSLRSTNTQDGVAGRLDKRAMVGTIAFVDVTY